MTRQACYFFYGAPFYRLQNRLLYELTADELDQHGVGFLVSEKLLKGMSIDVYPFDTGAQRRGMFAPYIDNSSEARARYRVATKNGSLIAAQLVQCLFGGNEAYLSGYGIQEDREPGLAPLRALRTAKLKADIRRQCVEMICLEPVRWMDEKFVVFAPKNYLNTRRKESALLDAALSHQDAILLTYNDHIPFGPESDSRAILEKAIDWLRQAGLMGANS